MKSNLVCAGAVHVNRPNRDALVQNGVFITLSTVVCFALQPFTISGEYK